MGAGWLVAANDKQSASLWVLVYLWYLRCICFYLFIFLSLLSPEVVIKVILFHAVRWKIENSGQKQTSMSVDNLS